MTMAPAASIDFERRWVVVTGASSGIGRACAEELSRCGAGIVLVGRHESSLARTRDALPGQLSEIVVLDLRNLGEIDRAMLRVCERIGRFYGLCHAAGVVTTRPLSASTPDVVEEMIRVNTAAGLELARAVTKRTVMEAEGGSLLFISSIYAKVGAAGQVAYAASKGAIAAAVRAMAVELARRRIRVNAISPGLVRTPLSERALGFLTPEQVRAIEQKHPLGPGAPDDVARAAVFLLAPSSRWITGADLAVDGGYSAA